MFCKFLTIKDIVIISLIINGILLFLPNTMHMCFEFRPMLTHANYIYTTNNQQKFIKFK